MFLGLLKRSPLAPLDTANMGLPHPVLLGQRALSFGGGANFPDLLGGQFCVPVALPEGVPTGNPSWHS